MEELNGVLEILNLSQIKEVSKYDFLNKEFGEAVFVELTQWIIMKE